MNTSLAQRFIQKIALVYPTAKRWLYRFHGGVFPPYHKSLSLRQPIRPQLIPDRLILPLQQQVGQPAELLVEVGSYVKKNQLLAQSHKDANKDLVVPVHAPTSGFVEAIEAYSLPHASGLKAMSIVIKPDHKENAIDNVLNVNGALPETPQAIKEILFHAGIVGMGGAGFPSYAKLPKEKGKIHTLLINGAECEPFITCDDLLMQTKAHEIIQGAVIVADALGADKLLCGIESNKPEAIQAMQTAAAKTRVEIHIVQTVYPMGGQKQLIQELTGIEVPHNLHSVDLGLLMMNVATYAAIYRAVTFGEPLTSRLVTVSGLGLESPFNIQALIGTPFAVLANAAQPKVEIDYPLVMGGPMMGFQVQDNQVPVIKTTNCILANPPEPIEMQMPCIRCGECMDACPVNLLPQQLYWYSQSHEFDKVEKLNIADCIECGCCSYVCPSHIPLVQYYRHAKSEIKVIHAEVKAAEIAKQRHEFRLARIEREKLERETRLQAKKDAVKKQVADKLAQAGDSPESAVAPTQKSSPAVLAARAAAARRAAKSKATSTKDHNEPESDQLSPKTPVQEKMPTARRKAIEAAQKASEAAGTEKNPKTAAKNAAMAAAKKRALAKKQEVDAPPFESNDRPNETSTATSTEQRAANIPDVTDASQSTQTPDLTLDSTSEKLTKEVDDVTQNKRQKAIEAARKRARERQAKPPETN
ncbi:electron transport complex subunit RsxC [Thiomicrorhabdus arctica]|uniref:electron transport complex subunit RsxC n=1 Tax=Thiomicrorhabdus arctica TaxID=131540 RepID=UPI00035CEF1D|nr:electron transport complex subunit RsxC [Thiomicrorhabdus arctica]